MSARGARRLGTLGVLGVAVAVALADHPACAAGPSTEECLAASDASMKDVSLRREHADLVTCSARSCPADVRAECAQRAADVGARIPTVRFSVRTASGEDVRDVRVRMGSELLVSRLDGKPVPVEPGEHTFTFEAARAPEVAKKLVFREGEQGRTEIIVLGAPGSPPATPSVAPTPQAAPEPPPEASHFLPATEPSPRPPPGGQAGSGLGIPRVLALVAGGVGIAGLAAGVATTFVAISKKSAAEGLCPATLCASQEGVDAWASARTAGDVSTVAFVVGAAGVAGGLLLWFTAPSGAHVSAGIGAGAIEVSGTW